MPESILEFVVMHTAVSAQTLMKYEQEYEGWSMEDVENNDPLFVLDLQKAVTTSYPSKCHILSYFFILGMR